jgi:hypothetical protein
MKALPDIFLIGYGLMLVGVGLATIYAAECELLHVIGLDPAWLALPENATFLNHYRFLKAAEAAFGLFCLSYRRDILAGGQANVLFLFGCGLGIFARLLSCGIDGRPSAPFAVLIALEALTFLLVWRHARNGSDQLK